MLLPATLFPASPHFFFFFLSFFRYSSAQVLSLFVSKKKKKKVVSFYFLYQMQLFYTICFNSWVSLQQLKKLIFIYYFLIFFFWLYQGHVIKFIQATFFIFSLFLLYQIKEFSTSLLFHPLNQTHKGKTKSFLSIHFYTPSLFSILPIK